MVAQAGASIGDTAIGELDVESSERRGNAFDKEGMQIADGRISALHLVFEIRVEIRTYRKAGSRPKKAMNVTSDTVTVKMMMLRASPMVDGFGSGNSL